MVCVSAAACSGTAQVLSVDPVSHFHTVRYKLRRQGYVRTARLKRDGTRAEIGGGVSSVDYWRPRCAHQW